MSEPTWITEARQATAAQDAEHAANARQRAAEKREAARANLCRVLEANAIPLEPATFHDDARWGLVASVDGYQFISAADYGHWAVCRILRCAICTQDGPSQRVARGVVGDLGALLDDDTLAYHHCPGRPVGPEDYDEEGNLLPACVDCRLGNGLCAHQMAAPASPPPEPTRAERTLAALERIASAVDYLAQCYASTPTGGHHG
jgi:hypothetical protein